MLFRSVALCLILLSCSVSAIEQVQLHLGDIESEGWRLEDVSLSFGLSAADPSGLHIDVASLEIGSYRIKNLRLTCAGFELLPAAVDCANGQLSLSSDALSAKAIPASFHYRFDSGELNVSVSALPLAGGKVGLQFHQREGEWRFKAQLADTLLSGVAGLIRKAGQGVPVKFIQEGRYKYIPYHKLFRRTEIIKIDDYGKFEGYANRSEERRVGKEGRSRCSPYQ